MSSILTAPATFEVRKRRSYVVCGRFAILCFLVLNAFSDGIFVRFCSVFAEKCRICVVEKSVGNDLFQCLYILCVFYINNINVILL